MAAVLAGFIALGQVALGFGLVAHHQGSEDSVDWAPTASLRGGHTNASLLSHRVWNSTATWVSHEVHEIEMQMATHENVNKVTYVLLAMLFPFCGFDRCFMGQVLCGCLKFSTCGGCFCWAIVDYLFAFYVAVAMHRSVNQLGYQAQFDPETIDGAYWVGLALFVVNALHQMIQVKHCHDQLQKRNEILTDMQNNSKAAEQTWLQQSLVLAPTFASRTLRKVGALSENVTLPEAIGLFERLDTNGDGELDYKELRDGLMALGASEEQINTIMQVADTNEDGHIDRMEFLQAIGVQIQPPPSV